MQGAILSFKGRMPQKKHKPFKVPSAQAKGKKLEKEILIWCCISVCGRDCYIFQFSREAEVAKPDEEEVSRGGGFAALGKLQPFLL